MSPQEGAATSAATLASPMLAQDTTLNRRRCLSSPKAITVAVAKALQSFSTPDTSAAHIKAGLKS
jgi:hypothetical protein